MPRRAEIWYFEDSLAAPLARFLSRRFLVRALSPSLIARPNFAPEQGDCPVVCLADLDASELAAVRRLVRRAPRVRLIGVSRSGSSASAAGCFATLPRKASPSLVRKTVEAAISNIELTLRERAARADLARAEREMEELNRIGIALSQTHEVGALLRMILTKAREITGADAGSLYLVEETRPDVLTAGQGDRRLRFKLTQNDSVQFPFAELRFRCGKIPWPATRRCTARSSAWPMPGMFPAIGLIASIRALTKKRVI